jgi:uncharacterized protein
MSPSSSPTPAASSFFEGRSAAAQWIFLLLGSAAMALVFEAFGLPAALLLGPMAAGVAIGAGGGTIRVAQAPYAGAQAILGCMIARVLSPSILVSFLKDGPLFVAVIAAVIAASGVLGWAVSRFGVLPGATAVWGVSPGAAGAMMIMAEAYGADAQTVALMQYLRVVFVATAASVIAHLFAGPGAVVPSAPFLGPIHGPAFVETLAVAALGGLVGWLLRLPAGTLLIPLTLGALVHGAGLMTIELPPWTLALAYAVIGWRIGLGFTRAILRHAWRALPQIVASILALMAFCELLALCLTWARGVDPLSAYLATSPGGIDSVAIIAASTKVDVSFVMAMQTVRFVLVLLIGPWMARFLAARAVARTG